MKLIVSEKPAVMESIANVIGNKETLFNGKTRYFKCGEYYVASCCGHLVSLMLPDELDEKYKSRNIADLPIIPQNFKFKSVESTEGYLNNLQNLFENSEITEIIEATDAGREGECIFRYVYNFLGCKKPVKRLWISSMTDESIRKGLANLQSFESKNLLFAGGFARAKIDWLIGMNFSRLFSTYYRTNYSIGRVQTPTLNMIYEREMEIVNFKGKKFFKVQLENGATWFDELDEKKDSFDSKEKAEKIVTDCKGKTVEIVEITAENKSENRPLLYSLTSLQIEANEKYSYSPELTLQTIQELYQDKKLLTYPRTDSNFLTDDMGNFVADIVDKIGTFAEYNSQILKLQSNGLNLDKRVVDNSKVSDHHAIIPTENIDKLPEIDLTDEQENILKLVIKRLLTTLDKPYTYEQKKYVFTCNNHKFKLTTNTPIDLGFKEFTAEKVDINSINYKKNDTFVAENLNVKPSETKPPKVFNEATLLSAMENISRRVTDNSKAEFVKERGLGTPATRAAIIAKLQAVNKKGLAFLEKKGRNLAVTEYGKTYLQSLPARLKSVDLTAEMEEQISFIEQGKVAETQVLSKTYDLLNTVISDEKSKVHEVVNSRESLGKCPKCGGEVFESDKNFYCENNMKSCYFSIFKNDLFWSAKEKSITADVLKTLLLSGKVLIKGFKSKDGKKTYDAYVKFKDWTDKNGKIRVGFDMEFVNNSGGKKAK